jgi:hypothetical protein
MVVNSASSAFWYVSAPIKWASKQPGIAEAESARHPATRDGGNRRVRQVLMPIQ